MKKHFVLLISILLIMALFAGCGKAANTETTPREPTDSETVAEPAPSEPAITETVEAVTEAPAAEPEEDFVYEGDAYSFYIDEVYYQQIGRYATALAEQWEEGKYLENGLSGLPSYYYGGNPLENVGFGFVDLDNDGNLELIIGAILGADQDPSVFEIWTLANDEPVMLAQAGSKNHYALQYVEEDGMWYVVNEATNSAYNYATYYLMLNEGKFEVVQGIVFNAAADENNPWFMTYDMDWDISNDDPIDEYTASAIIDSNRPHYTAVEYFPYIFFN